VGQFREPHTHLDRACNSSRGAPAALGVSVKQIFLPGGKRTTSRLGYGTSGLHGGWDKRASLRLLETAFDAGLRPFDPPPIVGIGDCEAIVGEFLGRHREQVSITTKFGLLPPK